MTGADDPLAGRLARIGELIGTAPRPVVVTEHAPDPEVEAWRAAAIQRRADEAWRSTVPARFHTATLDGLDPVIRGPLEAWVTGPRPRPNLLLAGPVGVGKTWAACAAIRPLVAQGERALFAPLVELLDWLRPSGTPEAWRDAIEADVLVLDDLGTERPTDWTAERLYGLVNRRWSDQRPIVATTNMRAADLTEGLGQRNYSRLLGEAVIVRLAGPDRRRSQPKENP